MTESTPPTAAAPETAQPRASVDSATHMPALLGVAILALVLWRVAYHAAYVLLDPFARITLSDGQLYEEAARDVLAHAPLGTQPFYLQGLYAYMLAAGMALRGELLDGLLLQLALAACALWMFWKAASASFGPRAGAMSLLVLLACPSLAFYENKFLSASLGVLCNAAVLLGFVRFSAAPSRARASVLGALCGLALLARPNMLFALPFTALGMLLVMRSRKQGAAQPLLYFALGAALALAPMAARNAIVTGRPTVMASHGGGIPFYIGNGPLSTGLWNDAGGLLSGQVGREQDELAAKLGIAVRGDALDKAIGQALYARAFHFIVTEPLSWLKLEAKKLRMAVGNHEYVHDYDLLGERDLLGIAPVGLPFGVILALGVLGLLHLLRRARQPLVVPDEHAGDAALLCVVAGQLIAVLLANVVWFTASQHRMPLVLPLAFCAGPMLAELATSRSRPTWWAIAVAGLLAGQAFLPQPGQSRPSSVHYYNLANAEEMLQRYPQALGHYQVAAERSPEQPMFVLRFAHLARRMHRDTQARTALDALLKQPGLPKDIAAVAREELRIIDSRKAPAR